MSSPIILTSADFLKQVVCWNVRRWTFFIKKKKKNSTQCSVCYVVKRWCPYFIIYNAILINVCSIFVLGSQFSLICTYISRNCVLYFSQLCVSESEVGSLQGWIDSGGQKHAVGRRKFVCEEWSESTTINTSSAVPCGSLLGE